MAGSTKLRSTSSPYLSYKPPAFDTNSMVDVVEYERKPARTLSLAPEEPAEAAGLAAPEPAADGGWADAAGALPGGEPAAEGALVDEFVPPQPANASNPSTEKALNRDFILICLLGLGRIQVRAV